jgi:hypothetical protein
MNSAKKRGIGGSIAAWALAGMSLYACGGSSDPGEGTDGSGGSGAAGSGGDATCSSIQRGAPCTDDFYCSKQGSCGPCGCCSEAWDCRDGKVAYLGYNDGCFQPASVCSGSGSGGWTAGGSGGQSGNGGLSAGGAGGLSAGGAGGLSAGGAGGLSAGGTSAGEGGVVEGGAGEFGAGEGGATG